MSIASDPAGRDAIERTRTAAARESAARSEVVLLRFELFVADTERSMRFYEEALDFTACVRGTGGTSGYAELSNGAVRIGIVPVAALPEGHYFRENTGGRPGVGVEIVFEVDDILECERRARLAGAVFESLRRRPWGRRDFRVVDPDGYYIRVTETLRDGSRGPAPAATRMGSSIKHGSQAQ